MGTAYENMVVRDGPLYYWPLRETSGAGKAMVGGVDVTYSAGVVGTGGGRGGWGSAPNFTGSASAQTAATVNLSGQTTVTLEWWIYRRLASGADAMMMEHSADAGVNAQFWVSVGNAENVLVYAVGGTGYRSVRSVEFPPLASTRWVHCLTVMPRSASSPELWIDGAVAGTAFALSAAPSGSYGNHTFNFMGRNNTSLRVPGAVQDVAIYAGDRRELIRRHINEGQRTGRRRVGLR